MTVSAERLAAAVEALSNEYWAQNASHHTLRNGAALAIGLDPDGYRVTIRAEYRNEQWWSSELGSHTTDRKVLSLTAESRWRPHCDCNQGGQMDGTIKSTLDDYRKLFVPAEDVREILAIWDRWHLNGAFSGQPVSDVPAEVLVRLAVLMRAIPAE